MSPKKYVFNGLFITIVVGLSLDSITFGTSRQNIIHYIMRGAIGIMVIYDVISLIFINKGKYQMFL